MSSDSRRPEPEDLERATTEGPPDDPVRPEPRAPDAPPVVPPLPDAPDLRDPAGAPRRRAERKPAPPPPPAPREPPVSPVSGAAPVRARRGWRARLSTGVDMCVRIVQFLFFLMMATTTVLVTVLRVQMPGQTWTDRLIIIVFCAVAEIVFVRYMLSALGLIKRK